MNPLSWFYQIRSYVDAYAGFLGGRFLSLIWVVALGVVIWFYGYLLGYGDFKPLESVNARLIAIGVLLAGWIIYMVISIIRARRRDQALLDTMENDSAAAAAASQKAEVSEIHERLKEAMVLLRRITRKRFGYVYELPWYVIFGAPGSGKTTALTNSGLKFPLGDAMGANAVQGIGGTRNCNWWFTDEAILIDTAGRYTTQDDLTGASKAGWEGFLGLLRRYRRSQPVNGVLITISIGDLLVRGPAERQEELRAIRQRLSELDELLGARVPVYLVLTKADLLEGFVDFFDGFNKSDREQVWGTTFGLDESQKGENMPERFLAEFALLQERVDAMLLERLQQEPELGARGRLFRFPAELASIKEKLHEVLTELCASSKLIEAPLLRGVYFVSGTQELAAAAAAPAPRMQRSYFLTRLFTEVIFGEAALVARDRRLSRRQLFFRRAAYGLATALVVGVLASWTITFFQNTSALAQAEEYIAAYEGQVEGIAVGDVADADFLRILPALDNLRNVTSGFSAGGIWPASFGLDQAPKIAGRHREAYQRALNALLLPRMLVQLQTKIDESENVGETFDALKFYGMLGGLGPVEPEFVTSQAEAMFDALYPGEGRIEARAALVGHATAMAAGALPQINLDPALIAEARETIRDQSIAGRAYDILLERREAMALAPWVPADALGPVGEQAFERASGAPLRDGIAGIFTADGYRNAVLPQVSGAAEEALREQWVRGEDNPAEITIDTVSQAALQLYFDNFEQQWSQVLTDMRVRPSQSLGDATETTRLLATDPSPIEAAARSLVAATDLRPLAAVEGETVASDVALGDAIIAPDPYGALREAMAAAPADTPAEGEEAAPTRFEALQTAIDEVSNQLSRATMSSAEVAQVFNVDSQLTTANQDLLQEARDAPAPVDTWVAGITADIGSLAVKTARSRFGDLWASEGALCATIVDGRYPFDRASTSDVAMSDFVRLFAPSGLFKSFFTEQLEPFVDTATSPWTWRGTFGAPGLPSEALAQFEKADTITRAFFESGSETPSVSINVKPLSLTDAANVVMLEIDGERVVYFHGPVQSKSLSWPSAEAINLSRIAFLPGGLEQAVTETGDWSVFRLFDEAEIADVQNDLFRAAFAIGNYTAEFEIQFGSVLNPFRLEALSDFTCPSQF